MDFKQAFEAFNGKRIVVVGDVMIDAYLMGKVNRVSPEAPVPIVSLSKQDERLGGAANVALNLVALGAQPIICSVVGQDYKGKVLKALLEEGGIEAGLIESSDRKTTIKTRVIGNNQHLLRIDEELTSSITETEENALIDQVKAYINQGIDGIIFEDYNKGVLTPKVIESIIHAANAADVITTVDPKKDNFFMYQNVTLFKPNLKELKEGTATDFNIAADKSAFENAVNAMESKLNNKISFITLSEHGVFIKDTNQKVYFPAHLRNIADVSGAGDTVISVATLCLVAGLDIKYIAEIANIAGGLVCESSGVVSIDKDQLLKETIKLIA